MKLIHQPNDGESNILAKHIETADSIFEQTRGLMFQRSFEDESALVFEFPDSSRQALHMLFVPFDIDAIWAVDGEVTQVKRLSSWTGVGWSQADTVFELPADSASDVNVGDNVVRTTGKTEGENEH